MAAGKQQHAASMVPSTFVEGGLWDDLDVEISDIAWTKFNFAKEGAPAQLRLALGVEFWPLEGLEPGKEPYQQMFSAGDLKFFVPSADDGGAYAIPVGDKTAMNSNTNAAAFLTSLFECATPEQNAWLNEALADGNSKALIGLQLHLKRQPQKERKGLSQQENSDRTPTVLLATNILALPGEVVSVVPADREAAQPAAPAQPAKPAQPAGPARPAGPAATRAAAPAKPATPATPATTKHAVGGKANGAATPARPAAAHPAALAATGWDMAAKEAKAQEALKEVLDGNQGFVEFAELPKKAFNTEALKTVPPKTRQEICAIVYDEAWLTAQAANGVAYDPATGTVALA